MNQFSEYGNDLMKVTAVRANFEEFENHDGWIFGWKRQNVKREEVESTHHFD